MGTSVSRVITSNVKNNVLTIPDKFNEPLDDATIPENILSIIFGKSFNQDIMRTQFPSKILSITFGEHFDNPLRCFPNTLEYLRLGDNFNQSVNGLMLPISLKTLIFGESFNRSIDGIIFNPNLENIVFGRYFNQEINVILPDKLMYVTFGMHFNQSLTKASLSVGLKSVSFGSCFNQTLDGLPESVEEISFDGINHDITHIPRLTKKIRIYYGGSGNFISDAIQKLKDVPLGCKIVSFNDLGYEFPV
ncbi:MAG: hypothetical protein Gaeavirus12_14 [Gaeavirus sp.]|uniref:F-box and FNIP repeat-containing protein n=1 Tax=Gaeavirus sp. TaxID=2487767 RepID=A0A3G4ZYZ1_9VIRU|nr:MAG: hypothetical protein Gaeavirus12_3 [Gaeavirus sp.]AYV80156.1 MAG: hypothetical protein Gaeavirus12_14 [Gaeavirus sp.]